MKTGCVQPTPEPPHGDWTVEKVLDLQHEEQVLSACVSSQRTLIASGAEDQIIRVRSRFSLCTDGRTDGCGYTHT